MSSLPTMASLTNADPGHRLFVDTPPPIPKDMQGSDSSVPLSPQWLLPKLGDNKLGLAAAMEPHPHIGQHTDPAKAPGNVEDLSITEKRKDVYRPSFFGTEKGRRDRWGDEEREASSVIRRDHQREGEELGDSRRLERWSNTASRYSGEARRFPSERWTDSGSKESTYEPRRESKWNSRWGPDDKEPEKRREKWSGKDGESSHDKGAHHPTIHAKDTDKEGEHNRLWRSSLVVNRIKGEITNKTAPIFGHGRGKGDSGASTFSVDRGRGGPARHFPLGNASDRSNGSHRDHHIVKYSRMKLLDICRSTDLKGYRMSSEWFQEFPSLMQADPLMPLSLIVPTAEELFILEAIDKGDILSSGIPLASKDGSSGKNSVDSGLLLPTKSGIGEDVSSFVSDHRDERTGNRTRDHSCYMESSLYDKCSLGFDSKVPSGENLCQSQEVLPAEESKFEIPPNKAQDSSKAESSISCRSPSVEGEGFRHVHGHGDPFILRDKLTDRKPQQYPSPEHLSLFYKDPQGQIQGPFSGSNLIEWFDAGYFGIDLLVCLENAPADSPFSLLGDVIPQLRTRVRPPPGFGSARMNDIMEVPNKGKFGGPGGIHAGGASEFELKKNGQVFNNESKVKAENQFLESLMSGRPLLGIENSNDMKFLPQKMPLEQHQSPLPSPYRPGRESPAIGEFPIPLKILPQFGEVPHQIPHQPLQQMDLLSILQAAADKTPPPPINSALPLWQNLAEFQSQFQPPLSNQTPVGILPCGVIPPEKLEFNQDSQMVDILRQQYMLAQQMGSQVPLTTHLNQMELLLLIQRQQQEQQQQNQLLMQKQQQHILSHPLSPYFAYNNELSFSQMHETATQSSRPTNVLDSNTMDAPPLLDEGQLGKTSNIVSFGEGHPQEVIVPRSNSVGAGASKVSHELPQTNEISTVALDKEYLDLKLPSVSEMIDTGVQISSPATIALDGEAPKLKGVEDGEHCEVKKVSAKKSRKHKNSQLRVAAECGKGTVKASSGQKSKTNFEIEVTLDVGVRNCAPSLMESSLDSSGDLPSSSAISDTKIEVDERETKVKEHEFVPSLSNNQAWKSAPGLKKKKPFLEIQMEEQRMAQTQSMAADIVVPEILPPNVSSAPSAAGSSINSDPKYDLDLGQSISENQPNPSNSGNISQLPDALDKEEKDTSYLLQMGGEIEATIDYNDDFIEAKETRKNRKKAAKNKGVAVKASSLPINSAAVVSVSATAAEQTKTARQIQKDKDLSPTPPPAPSLGDFVFWKGDQTSTVPLSPPAWSTESMKLQKPTFLRDIIKEQDKKKTKSGQQQTPTKVQPSKGGGGSTSPSKVSAPMNSNSAGSKQTSSVGSGQRKGGMEEDFFWGGPISQSKEGSRLDFPSIANNPSSQNVKGTSIKDVQGEGSSKKSSTSKPVGSPAISRSPFKGKKDTESKYSEAMDFRNWCEGEWLRLTGTNDTSFLEFCLKQSTTEAAVLLKENLVSLDHDREFIDKFINYKEFLSSEVIEIAFQSRKSSKKSGGENQPQMSYGGGIQRMVDDAEADGSSKGKKKGKKGKKLSPSLLGFSVASSRIMMGEIQSIED